MCLYIYVLYADKLYSEKLKLYIIHVYKYVLSQKGSSGHMATLFLPAYYIKELCYHGLLLI